MSTTIYQINMHLALVEARLVRIRAAVKASKKITKKEESK